MFCDEALDTVEAIAAGDLMPVGDGGAHGLDRFRPPIDFFGHRSLLYAPGSWRQAIEGIGTTTAT